jgi:hypothetical protein
MAILKGLTSSESPSAPHGGVAKPWWLLRVLCWVVVIAAGLLIQESYVKDRDASVTDTSYRTEEERLLTAGSWQITDDRGIMPSINLWDDDREVGAVWTFDKDGTLRAGKPRPGSWEYKGDGFMEGPVCYEWLMSGKTLSIKSKFKRFPFPLYGPIAISESELKLFTLEIGEPVTANLHLKTVPRIEDPPKDRQALAATASKEERILTAGSWKIVEAKGVARGFSEAFDPSTHVDSVWTFHRDGDMKAGPLREDNREYEAGPSTPQIYGWTCQKHLLSIKRRNKAYDFQLLSIDQAEIKLARSRERKPPKMVAILKKVSRIERSLHQRRLEGIWYQRLSLAGIWLPAVCASALAYELVRRSRKSRGHAFFKSLFLTVCLGMTFGALIGISLDSIERDLWVSYFPLFPLWQSVICFVPGCIVGIASAFQMVPRENEQAKPA